MKNQNNLSKTFLVFLAIIFLFSINGDAEKEKKSTQKLPKKEAKLKWLSFKEVHAKSEIEWDTKTGNPHELRAFATKAYEGIPKVRAESFLKDHHQLLGMDKDLSGLKHLKTSKLRVKGKTGIDYVKFMQFHQGLPVVGTETIVHVTETGKVFRVYNRFYSDIQVANKRKISEEEAIGAARKKLNKKVKKKGRLPGKDKAELTVYPLGDKFYFAWQVQASYFRYYIDAENGKVLHSTRTLLFAAGNGSVYQENSCDTPTRITGSLPNLDGSGYLQGTYFDVQSTGTRAHSASFTYNYPTTDSKFSQVEIYYQLERARTYLGDEGFTPSPTQTTVYDDYELGILFYCNAAYDWGNNQFLFAPPSSGGGCTSTVCAGAGEDGDIIFHEYGHQVIHQTSSLDPEQHMPASIHEAVADYFSCSFFNDPEAAEPFFDGCGTSLRDISVDKSLPGDADWSDPHIMGLILASALWDIRESAGQPFTDWLVYNALPCLPPDADFDDFARCALDVIAARIDDVDNWVVKLILALVMEDVNEKFCNHGIVAYECD